MRNEKHLRDAILMSLQAGEPFIETLVAVLGEIAPIRNKAAHGELVDRKTALRWRNQMLGIGCEGLISELERARVIVQPPASGKARS
jgi:phage terminase large subunit-like protein